MTKIKIPESFTYLGQTFEPVTPSGRYDWNKLSSKVWGNDETLKPLEIINNNGYDWDEFYKVAKKHGCGKVDVFILLGEKVIPCNRLMYYGEPTWYQEKHAAEIALKKHRTLQRELAEDLCDNLKKAIMERVIHMPENWDGIEIRRWIGEYYNDHFANLGTFEGKRKKDFKNELIINNKIS